MGGSHAQTAQDLLIAGAGFFIFALIAGRLQRSPISPPMLFVGFGILVGPVGFDLFATKPSHETLYLIAELALVLILFSDASAIRLRNLERHHVIPACTLGLGLPLTVAAGTLAAMVIFADLPIWQAALLGALLAPTDAALGQPVLTNDAVPQHIREAINVESGLNDGLALPLVLFFAAMAGATENEHQGATGWIAFLGSQVAIGALAGAAVGAAGAKMLDWSERRSKAAESFQAVAGLALAVTAYAAADRFGGNGFVAAYVGGLTFGNVLRRPARFVLEFMETEGKVLEFIVFLVFATVLLPAALPFVDWRSVLYAALSLTVLRMLPIALSLIGSRVGLPTILFIGWFGPRGIATILFVLLVIESGEISTQSPIIVAAVLTVAMSVLAHGISAEPLSRLYARLSRRQDTDPGG